MKIFTKQDLISNLFMKLSKQEKNAEEILWKWYI